MKLTLDLTKPQFSALATAIDKEVEELDSDVYFCDRKAANTARRAQDKLWDAYHAYNNRNEGNT